MFWQIPDWLTKEPGSHSVLGLDYRSPHELCFSIDNLLREGQWVTGAQTQSPAWLHGLCGEGCADATAWRGGLWAEGV